MLEPSTARALPPMQTMAALELLSPASADCTSMDRDNSTDAGIARASSTPPMTKPLAQRGRPAGAAATPSARSPAGARGRMVSGAGGRLAPRPPVPANTRARAEVGGSMGCVAGKERVASGMEVQR